MNAALFLAVCIYRHIGKIRHLVSPVFLKVRLVKAGSVTVIFVATKRSFSNRRK
jgi:hypothetical protein